MQEQITPEEYQRRLNQIQPQEYEQLLPWYMENCKSIHEIHCGKSKDAGETLIALEIDTNSPITNIRHHEGKFVVAVGGRLLSYRPRLDGAMGYQAFDQDGETVVDSLWSQIEKDNVPPREIFSSVSVDTQVKLKSEIQKKKYMPAYKNTKQGYKIDGFELKKVTV